jgi:hypothetical protein
MDGQRLLQRAVIELEPEDVVRAGSQSPLHSPGVGRGGQLPELVEVFGGIVENGPDQAVVGPDPGFEIGVNVVFDQDREAVAELKVIRREPRLELHPDPALGGIPVVPEIPVPQTGNVVCPLADPFHGRHHDFGQVGADPRIAVGIDAPGVGGDLLVEGAVGRVAIDEKEGIPAAVDVFDVGRDLRAFDASSRRG